MKKILSLLVVLFCAVGMVSAQTIDKQAWKEAKKTAKDLEKTGWILKSPGDLAMCLYAFDATVKEGNCAPIVEEATSSLIQVAEDKAKTYAMEAAVKQIFPDAADVVVDFDSCLRHSITLLRFERGGHTTCRVYYLLDKKAAARCKAVVND